MKKPRSNIGIYKHSELTKEKIAVSNTGKLSSQWKGDNAKYQALHGWIRNHYGLALFCVNPDCSKLSQNFEWALKPGKKYSRDINDYMQLCKKCHRKMDFTEETRQKMSKSLTQHEFCTVPKCGKEHLAKGYCPTHYNTIYRKLLSGADFSV